MTGYNVIGIDPSMTATGIAFNDGTSTTVKTTAQMGNPRLQLIYDAVYNAAGAGEWKHTPTLAVMEDLPTRAMSAGKLGQVQGVTRLALVMAGVSILTITPASLKKFATNKGNAKKHEMIAAWNTYANAEETDDNRVDALWLREIGLYLMDMAGGSMDDWLAKKDPRLPAVMAHMHVAISVRQGYVFQ